MKFLSTIAILVSTSTVFAITPKRMAGEFTETFEVPVFMHADAASCQEDGGKWDGEVCMVPASNDVKVTYRRGKHQISVSTIGSNLHVCGFEGPARRLDGSRLVASQKADVWNGDDWVPGICEVTVKYLNDQTVSVGTNGKCQSFCGANAWLEIDAARRK